MFKQVEAELDKGKITRITEALCATLQDCGLFGIIGEKIVKDFCNRLDFSPEFTKAAVMMYRMQERNDKTNEKGRRGRRIIEQLFGCYRDEEVCVWFDKIRSRLKRYIGNLTQLICCFFAALYDVITTECPDGKGAHYYRMIKNHIKEKMPGESTIQKGIRWLLNWKRNIRKGIINEEDVYRVWKKLQSLIADDLPKIEPTLAMCRA